MPPETYRESIIWFNIWWVAKFRRPRVYPTNFADSPDEFDIRVTNSSVRSTGGAGHIIMLNDGSEVSTDSEDGEVFDDDEPGMEEESDDEEEESDEEEEQSDDEASERIIATEKREEGERVIGESKTEKGKENEEIDISSKTPGTKLESTDQKGESTTAK